MRHHLKRITTNTILRRRQQSLSFFRPPSVKSLVSLPSHKKCTSSNLYLNHYFHTSVSVCKTRHDVNDGKEWIPPSRPLTGDSSQSSLYVEMQKLEKYDLGEEARALLEKDLISGNESVHFVDLTNIDPETKEYLSSADNIQDNGIWEEVIDDDEYDGNYQDHDENVSNVSNVEDLTQDAMIREIINDPDFDDDDDDEMVRLQGQLIAERIRDLRIENKNKSGLPLHSVGSHDDASSLPSSKIMPTEEEDSSSDLDNFLKEQNFQSSNASPTSIEEDQPDWLRTRRSKLGIASSHQPTDMLTPNQAELERKNASEIPIIKDTLLSSDEITSCLKRLGAIDTIFVQPEEKVRPLLGWDGIIIATGSSNSHIRTLVDAIVSNLRRRDLAERGVIGARYGPEGGNAEMSAKKRRKLGQTKRGKRAGDGWMVVDCQNYLVHVQDDVTRRSIDLEGLWSPGERGLPGRELRNLDVGNEDEVDDYIAANPIPDEYTNSLITLTENFWSDGSGRGGLGTKSSKASARWTPVGQKKRKIENRRPRNRL